MEEQLVSFETAKLAKEKGFDINCNTGFHEDFGELENDNYPLLGTYSFILNCDCNNKLEYQIVAPTQSLVQRWLREKHNLNLNIWSGGYNEKDKHYSFRCDIHYITKTDCKFINSCLSKIPNDFYIFRSYEEALEQGLFEALTLIKN